MTDSTMLDWARDQVSKRAGQAYEGLQESGRGCASVIKAYGSRFSSQDNLKESIYTAAIVLLLFSTIVTYIVRRRNLSKGAGRPATPTTPALEKAASGSSTPKYQGREWGKWIPSDFHIPKPDPYPDWSVEHTKPLPYRPFRYGPKYNVTMGLRSLKHADWIELDNHYPRYHADKAQRIKERGHKCCRTAPEAYPAAIELLEELVDYLPARYPSMYKRTAVGIDNLWSGESFDITKQPLPEDPMQICARLVQDDLAIMIERPDSQYYLLAGAVLLAGFWRLEDKYGMVMSEIHTSGDVPQFKEKLEKGMMNFFRRLKPEELVARNNYFMQVDDSLGWSWSIGSEDSPHVSWNTAEKNRAIEHHYFRSERQSLRRLPKSGGIVFTIRTYFLPITEIVKEDYVPGRLASAVRSWGDDVSRYKGKERYGEVLLEYLDQKHKEQVERGLDVSKEDEVRAYPF
ncbi:mannosyl transferase [Jackrogersella minutella]|nr:mannosyl transferase [Jackrogersella minutella]